MAANYLPAEEPCEAVECPHLPQLISKLLPPTSVQNVHREECTQCFDSQESEAGIDVCLKCFNGGCLANDRNHAKLHFEKWGKDHSIQVNIKRRRKASKRDHNEPPPKKLAIREEPSEEEAYEFFVSPRCFACGPGTDSGGAPIKDTSGVQLAQVVSRVMSSASSAQRSEVKAWEEEIIPCAHTTELVQVPKSDLELTHCASCDLTSNLWLCLVCGNLGCGRQQFGGLGGHGHGLEHATTTGHSVSLKLGTVEPEGTGDVYCYACNDARLDPNLSKHLRTFGINVAEQQKTEKSMTELQVEQNLKFDFAMTGEDGKELEPLFGPGLTGMRNLGNSCYMASTLQALFSLPAFQTRYFLNFQTHAYECRNQDPSTCFECQMNKIADGLLSGRYAVPRSDSLSSPPPPPPTETPAGAGQPETKSDQPSKPFQQGIKPSMFKALVGKGHSEFSTMKQQDADEFLKHLLEFIKRSTKQAGQSLSEAGGPNHDPTAVFEFGWEEKLKCNECGGVRYRVDSQGSISIPVPAKAKTVAATAPKADEEDVQMSSVDEKGKDPIEGVNAGVSSSVAPGSSAGTSGKAEKTEYEPVKFEDCLKLLTEPEALEYKCPACKKNVIAIRSGHFATFPEVLAVHARRFELIKWVPTKLEVPIVIPQDNLLLDPYLGSGKQPDEVDLPEAEDAPAAAAPEFDAGAMATLEGMGFPVVRCQKALLATGNSDAEAAMNWLFGHMEDPDIDDPIDFSQYTSSAAGAGVGAGTGGPSPEQISMLCDMGFSPAQAKKALRETRGDAERAVDWLFSHPDDQGDDDTAISSSDPSPSESGPKIGGSRDTPAKYRLKAFISHKGPSVHSGHYVAHVWMGNDVGWVLMNDEKVVKADFGAHSAQSLLPFAYVYIFVKEV